MLKEKVKQLREQADAAEEMGKDMTRCLIIARRIQRGDHVPLKDHKYLAEHNPELYQMAMKMRMPNPDPEDHDSVLDDEEEDKSFTNYSLDMEEGGIPEPADSGGIDAAEAIPIDMAAE